MIAFLRGSILFRFADSVILDVNGVGYRVRVPTPTLARLGDTGSRAELHIHLHVREDDLSLFGFLTQDELELFEKLLTVSGIGPRVAMGALSAAPPNEIAAAIAQGNLDILTGIPGIGKKTAQRLVLELKGKVELAAELTEMTGPDQEVAETLINLGYSAAEAQRAARAVAPMGASLEERLRAALQYLGG
jgi:Holliday junction DNA helicase RuvA